MQTRLIHLHSACFHGWAQAFGNHDSTNDEQYGLRWLLGEDQLGLILTPYIRQGLGNLAADIDGVADKHPEGNGCDSKTPDCTVSADPITLANDALHIGNLTLPLANMRQNVAGFAADLLEDRRDLHLFQTYHLIYASATCMLTLSPRSPLGLIDREIEPLHINFEHGATAGLRAICNA
ncbi:MAG TPA: hypothetical protein DDY14_04190 [Chromatiaceae bacterium]|jgi:hypothetical protein|nr:MAG: hypothetical protein N838_04430 [Thiohalocapsa sp. PB-PSB1]QQO53755.1 MAG: hypothetical protein N838_10715 [Thiohalocapsa sp. PB-PSB1]HBG94527.1 hypothetical protein [Chromatiaceae bacterium]HCS91646.1 hypothetical protein [Chromatiaceae bacterium]